MKGPALNLNKEGENYIITEVTVVVLLFRSAEIFLYR